MAQMVKVVNDGSHTFEDNNWMGRKISIEPGAAIEMDLIEAEDFLGKFHSPKTGKNGLQDPATFKKLRIVRPSEEQDQGVEFKKVVPASNAKGKHVCNACGWRTDSLVELDDHVTENHLDSLKDPKEVEKRLKDKK